MEKWSGIGCFVIAKVTPVCWIMPKTIISYFLYFTADAGIEAFELPVFLWYAKPQIDI